ncbi:MAG: histidine phosphatase family protein [Clostridia bacterium]|nr:histidine phosphatase family protein [Clostridia bacterium]
MDTTIYLIRHSVRYDVKNIIDEYNTTEDKHLKNQKLVLTPLGEKRAEILSNEEELQNIDVAYASHYVRTLQTAKYLLEKQNLKINIDERFGERESGKPNDDVYPNWYELQYKDENFKTEGGESQLDVRNRVSQAFFEAVEKNRGKRIAIFAHDYAISFFLLKWCKVVEVNANRKLTLSFNDKIIFDKVMQMPEVFKLIIDGNNNPKSIELIEFDDLK